MQCNEIFPESSGDAGGSAENSQCVVDAKGSEDHIESLGDCIKPFDQPRDAARREGVLGSG